MPDYGYRCQSCQREFEVQKRMSDPLEEACPECGGSGTRLFYPSGILFKGSGFYKTDSRSTAEAKSSSGTDAPKPASEGGAAPAPSAPPANGSAAPPPAPAGASPPPTTPPATPSKAG